MMDDAELMSSLQALGLDSETYRAVALLPLIEVAWADGRVQRAEKRRILQIAKGYGMMPAPGWLDKFIRRKPSTKTFLAARTALLALMARSGHGGAPVESLDQLLDLCLWVAKAAGGLFGLAFTVERSERECIEQIAASLSLGPALPDPVVVAWREAQRQHNLAEAPTSHRRRQRYGILDQTTHHLDVGENATQPLDGAVNPVDEDDEDPLSANDSVARARRSRRSRSEAPTDGFDRSTIARVAVPRAPPPPVPMVPAPDDTGTVRAVGTGVADLVDDAFAGPDDLPTSDGPRPFLRVSPVTMDGIDPPERTPPPVPMLATPPPPPRRTAAPAKAGGAPGAAATTPPPPLGPTSVTTGARAPSRRLPSTPGARTARSGLTPVPTSDLADEDPTLPFFDDVNVGTYADTDEV